MQKKQEKNWKWISKKKQQQQDNSPNFDLCACIKAKYCTTYSRSCFIQNLGKLQEIAFVAKTSGIWQQIALKTLL